jgi:hypothetical protein
MGYPRQDKTIERLENVNRIAIMKIRRSSGKEIVYLWERAKDLMRNGIRNIYTQDFKSSTWNSPLAARRGTFHKIDRMVVGVLRDFHEGSLELAAKNLKQIYKQSVLRSAYVLDMITPASYLVKLPRHPMFSEASISTYQGPDADTAWKVRWSAWIDEYRNAINSNLRLNALNDSTADEAAAEVDASRAGTPAYETGDALDRIFQYQSASLQAQAIDELAGLNDDMELEQIWQTSFGARVCDICDENQGLTVDEADDDIPAHPNCLLPDNLVLAPDVIGASKSFYEGRCIEITFPSGRKISVTENHPILTTQGFVAAKFITESHEVIVASDGQRIASSIDPDYDNAPSRIEDVFNSLQMSSKMSSARMKSSAEDFHGDGKFIKGKIDVIGANGFLRRNYKSFFSKAGDQFFFNGRNIVMPMLQRISSLFQFRNMNLATESGLIGFGSDLFSFRKTHLSVHQKASLAVSPRFNSKSDQSFSKRAATDSNFFRQFLFRFARYIASEKALKIRDFFYSGHVYDLQCSEYSLFNCNSVIISNCECYWRLVPATWAKLLRSGDEEDMRLARWMDANGVVPGAMVIENEDGEPVGKAIVTYERWLEGQPQVVGAR